MLKINFRKGINPVKFQQDFFRRENIFGYGFGCPRVIFGRKSEEHKRIWKNFTVIRNIDDIVTHLPPSLLGFFHVGQMIEIGRHGKYTRIDAHRPENMLRELKLYEARR
mgnify:CR=1 FL=1